MFFRWIFWIFAGYLLGGILFSWHIPKWLAHKDTRKLSPDHNPGAGNAFIYAGWKIGLLCLFFDLLKGFLPVYGASRQLSCKALPFALVMLAPVLGHATAPFYRFSGGKSIAASFGVLIAVMHDSPVVWVLAFFYILFSTVLKIHSRRARSIVTFSLFGAVSALYAFYIGTYAIGIGCIAISAVVIYKHFTDCAHLSEKKVEAESDAAAKKSFDAITLPVEGESECEHTRTN